MNVIPWYLSFYEKLSTCQLGKFNKQNCISIVIIMKVFKGEDTGWHFRLLKRKKIMGNIKKNKCFWKHKTLIIGIYKVSLVLPWCLSHKESACQCRRCKFHPRVRKIHWRRKWQATKVFLPGKSHEQRSLAGYSPWSCKESDMTYQLNHNNDKVSICVHTISVLFNVIVSKMYTSKCWNWD